MVSPNYARLSASLITAGEEVSRLQNMPAFNDTERVLDAVTTLGQDINGRISEINARINVLRQDVEILRAELTETLDTIENNLGIKMETIRVYINEKVLGLQTTAREQLEALETNSCASIYTPHSSDQADLLHPSHDQQNRAVEEVSEDRRNMIFPEMTEDEAIHILDALRSVMRDTKISTRRREVLGTSSAL